MEPAARPPTLWQALLLILAVILMLGLGHGVLRIRIELVLVTAAVGAGLLGLHLRHSWKGMQQGIVSSLGTTAPALLIILAVGILIASWMASGTIPMIIDSGLHLVSPRWFLVTACIACSLASIVTGTSWGTIGTIGIALLAIGEGLGLPAGQVGGAIVAGAYFGDKLSPLSDSTNLAALAARVPLFDHVAHMLWTTVPAWLLGLVVYAFIGGAPSSDAASQSLHGLSMAIREHYTLHWVVLLPATITVVASLLRKPAVPSMLVSAAVAVGLAVTVQRPELYMSHAAAGWKGELIGVLGALVSGLSPATGNEMLDRIIGRGGMMSMMPSILVVFCTISFAGIAIRIGVVGVILEALGRVARTSRRLIAATISTCLLVAVTTGNGYLTVLLSGEMLAPAFRKLRLAAKNLSRITEDAGTVVVPLLPWSIAGVYIHGTLGVSAVDYGPWAIFCYTGLVVSLIYGVTGFTIAAADDGRHEE